MSEAMTKYELDSENLPPLTEEQQAELRALDEKPDSEIDYSDIPPLDEKFWANAVRIGTFKPIKTSTTVRVDADVLLWLRSKSAGGKGYQTRINAILRAAMMREVREAGSKLAGSGK
jgi:uncharacterized protein (DUF4415 family)